MPPKPSDPHEWIEVPAAGAKQEWEIPAEIRQADPPPSTKEVLENLSTDKYKLTIDE